MTPASWGCGALPNPPRQAGQSQPDPEGRGHGGRSSHRRPARSLRELEISDDTLIGLLVLALAGNNVRVQSGAKGDDFMVQHRA
ncbi:hypothetical protein, partial [Roseomonas chloroacetimidivorans]|uniref:hypothetical protein n=1 Tax=Roseomonas chloroacetimidivorans TaxID=1766656 RepID=UPI003C73E29A